MFPLSPENLIIGFDFDNTLVCYDKAFHKIANELQLIPSHIPPVKSSISEWIKSHHGNTRWTELQAEVYGPGMEFAEWMPGAPELLKSLEKKNIHYEIISHKTRFSVLGKHYDLHHFAKMWLTRKGFSSRMMRRVHFLPERSEKISLVRESNCRAFVDDLPEVLLDSSFPESCTPIWFNRSKTLIASQNLTAIHSLTQVEDQLKTFQKIENEI